MLFMCVENIQALVWTLSIIILQYPGRVRTFSRSSYTTPHYTTPSSRCNCIPVKDCTTLSTLMLNQPTSQGDNVYELVRDTSCGFLLADPLICCPTNHDLPEVTTDKDIWIWDRRAYRSDDDSINSRFATLNEIANLKTNLVDFKDPQTYKNNPQVFYENEEEYQGDSLLTQPYLPYHQEDYSHHSHDQHKHFGDFHYIDHDDDEDDAYPKSGFEQTTQPNRLKSPIVNSGNRRNDRPIIFPTETSLADKMEAAELDIIFSTTPHSHRNQLTPKTTTTEKTTTAKGAEATTGATATIAATTTTTINQLNAVSQSRNSGINSPNCGISVGTRIIGGVEGQNGQFSWITRIGYINTTSNRISYRCSGSVITEQYILTAAHCVTNLVNNLNVYHVLIGDMEISSSCRQHPNSCNTRQTFNIADIIIHKNYDQPKYANDIALLRIERPANVEMSYGTICLPLNNSASVIKELIGKTGIVAGWSTNKEGMEKTNSPNVKYLQLPIVNTTECAINYAKYSENFRDPIVITPSQMCAQGQPMNDVCRGDSGGPFMDDGTSGLINTNGRYTLLGIVAFGPTICGASNFPGVYTRVSSYVDWIASNIT